MSLKEALTDTAARMDEEADELPPSAARVLHRYAATLRTLVTAAADPPPVGPSAPGVATNPSGAAEQHRTMIEKARAELRASKRAAEGQEAYEEKMILCVGGPADGTYFGVPQPLPGKSVWCGVLGNRYRLEGGQLRYDPPPEPDTKGGGVILLGDNKMDDFTCGFRWGFWSGAALVLAGQFALLVALRWRDQRRRGRGTTELRDIGFGVVAWCAKDESRRGPCGQGDVTVIHALDRTSVPRRPSRHNHESLRAARPAGGVVSEGGRQAGGRHGDLPRSSSRRQLVSGRRVVQVLPR